MTAAENKAVFLSYASQDAEAARRICDALGAAGVEVWFDQSELRGGDAWDAKIRKQIKECALFVPVISANTQARREGYFRIEWKLAAQRTHAIAEGTPFLLPVVIDATPEPEALVPGEFREVQWTRLVVTESPAEFSSRVANLLAPDAAAAGSDPRTVRSDGLAAGRRPAVSVWWTKVVPLAGIAVGVFFALRPWWAERRAGERAGAARPAASAAAEELALKARNRVKQTPEELALAIQQAQRAVELAPESARAAGVRARLEGEYIRRGWDITEQKRQQTQGLANRALALNADTPDAMFALATVLNFQRAYPQVEALMRRAMVLQPDDPALRGALGGALSGQGREAEALALREETLRLFPSDPLAHYDLALSYQKMEVPDLEASLRKFDDSLALQRLTSAVLHKVALLAGWRGDLPAARRLLDELSPLERTGDRAVAIAMMVGLLEQKPERVIEAAALTAQNYFDDNYMRGPKAWDLAHAYTLAGKPSLAQAQWREAEAVLRERRRAKPGNWFDEAGLAITLTWLGASEEAARIMAPVEPVAWERPRQLEMLFVAYYHAARGDAARTAASLRPILNRRELLTHKTLPLDPWWSKVRDTPEFAPLLAPPSAPARR